MIVTTRSGASHQHLLDLGIGKRSEILQRMQARIAAIEERMSNNEALTLENPTISYNCSMMESVAYEVIGASQIVEQINAAMADASRPLGFGRPLDQSADTQSGDA
ncbi:MAG: hypothetical protein VW450_06490 [Chloroflexota bacterium]